MSHKLGVYFAPTHGRQSDRDFIQKLQPPVVRVFEPDVQQIADAHALAPNAIIAARTWAIDDSDGSAVRNLMADPVKTGHDHAQQYRNQWDRWQTEAGQRGLTLPPVERIMFNAANEPNQGGTPDKIAAYNIAFLNRCTELGIRAAALCLGVGWPDNSGPDTPVNWQPYAGIVEPIKRGSHWMELHEYHYKSGPQDGWRWLAGRHLQCPFDVPILLGEIGCDNYVDHKRWEKEGGNRGWKGNIAPDAYADMVERHIRGSDSRVVAALIFITDYKSNIWESFDTLEAHGALLARKDRMVPQVQFATTNGTPDPYVPKPSELLNPPKRGTVVATFLNVRSGPSTEYPVVAQLAHDDTVTVTAEAGKDAKWNQVGTDRWVYSGWLRWDEVTEPPTPVGDNWSRCRAFTKRWEGGFQDFDWDSGNWTGCEQGKGEKKGTNFGISACSYPNLDIRNITLEQADAIYFRDYWQASGADKLPWPLCLLVFDTSVNFHPTTAQKWLEQSGGNPLHFVALRLRGYRKSKAWEQAGDAWVDRVIEIALEASKA